MIDLPTFGDSHGVAMTACAHIVKTDPKIRRLIKGLPSSKNALVASIGKGSESHRVVLFGGGSGTFGAGHIHVTILRKLPSSVLPKANTAATVIRERIQAFAGHRAGIFLSAYFRVPIDDLPDDGGIVRPALALDAQLGDVIIRQTGASLKIVGGEVDTVEWSMRPDEKEIQIELEAHQGLVVNDSYLTRCYHLMHSAFQVLVLGEAVENG